MISVRFQSWLCLSCVAIPLEKWGCDTYLVTFYVKAFFSVRVNCLFARGERKMCIPESFCTYSFTDSISHNKHFKMKNTAYFFYSFSSNIDFQPWFLLDDLGWLKWAKLSNTISLLKNIVQYLVTLYFEAFFVWKSIVFLAEVKEKYVLHLSFHLIH